MLVFFPKIGALISFSGVSNGSWKKSNLVRRTKPTLNLKIKYKCQLSTQNLRPPKEYKYLYDFFLGCVFLRCSMQLDWLLSPWQLYPWRGPWYTLHPDAMGVAVLLALGKPKHWDPFKEGTHIIFIYIYVVCSIYFNFNEKLSLLGMWELHVIACGYDILYIYK